MNSDQLRLSEELRQRIGNLDHPLPSADWQKALAVLLDNFRTVAEIQPSYLTALNVRISYDLVTALRKMDQTNTALTRWLVRLTVVLVVLTAVLAIEVLLKWIHGTP